MVSNDQENSIRLDLYDVVISISAAVDLVSPMVNRHQRQVAMIAFAIGKEIGFPRERLLELTIAAALHDVGGLTLADRLNALSFEVEHPEKHMEYGFRLLKTFPPFDTLAQFVRYHHHYYMDPRHPRLTASIPLESHIIHLADRVAVSLKPGPNLAEMHSSALSHVRRYSRFMFHPQVAWMFEKAASQPSFWQDFFSGLWETRIHQDFAYYNVELNSEQMIGLARLFARIIDFRSPFTSAHSSGVAIVAQALSKHRGFGGREASMMHLAGFLHDLGKLAVPAEILDKPGPLSAGEQRLLKRHAYYTDRILKDLPGLDSVREWSAMHHERLDGSGYPYHLRGDEIPAGARIMAVADTYNALAENRPYRPGMNRAEICQTLQDMSRQQLLDGDDVEALLDNLGEMEQNRLLTQEQARREYEDFIDLETSLP